MRPRRARRRRFLPHPRRGCPERGGGPGPYAGLRDSKTRRTGEAEDLRALRHDLWPTGHRHVTLCAIALCCPFCEPVEHSDMACVPSVYLVCGSRRDEKSKVQRITIAAVFEYARQTSIHVWCLLSVCTSCDCRTECVPDLYAHLGVPMFKKRFPGKKQSLRLPGVN